MPTSSHRSGGRAPEALALLGLLACALTACATPSDSTQPTPLPTVSIEKYPDTVVEVDYAHGNGSLPADALDNNNPDNTIRALHAIAVSTDTCMVKRGFGAISGTVDWKPFVDVEDRVLGRWSTQYASSFGASPAPESGPPEVDLVSHGVDFNKAYATCQDSAKATLRPHLEFLQARNLISGIQSRAYELATKNAQGIAAIAAWKQCSEDAGIVLDPNDGLPVEEYKRQGKEAEIKTYVTHAECARSTQAIQAIYNLRARYELALMDSEQEQIATFKKRQDEVKKALDKAIAEG